MIHAALWIVSFCVVVWFSLVVLGIVAVLWRWILGALAIIVLLVFVGINADRKGTTPAYNSGSQSNVPVATPGSGSAAIQEPALPEHAMADSSAPDGWRCIVTYRRDAGKCVNVDLPQHAEYSKGEQGWRCQLGFVQDADRCIPDDRRVVNPAKEETKRNTSPRNSTPALATLDSVIDVEAPGEVGAEVSPAERQSIESVCSTDKYLNGPAAYRPCRERLLATLGPQNRRPDLTALSAQELQSIESACSTDKYLNGPAAYNSCLKKHLALLTPQSRRPDLTSLSGQELQSIESTCSTDKYLNGPAAYNRCLQRQLSEFEALEKETGSTKK
jgi:hypothetical protein